MSPELHDLLMRESQKTGRSMGELIRVACERQYGRAGLAERLAALEELTSLNLPVSDVATMKRESIAEPKPLPGWSPD